MFVNINMNDMFELFDVEFETYIEDKMVSKQQLRAPKEMLQMNFLQVMKQAANDRRPIKVRMIVPNVIWDDFDNKEIVLNNEISFSNNAMVAWEETYQNNDENKEA